MTEPCAAPMDDCSWKVLQKVFDWVLYSLIPTVVLALAVAIVSNSLSIVTIACDSGLSLVVCVFACRAIRIIRSQNVFIFPYGAGKLEDFYSFMVGVMMLFPALVILCTVALRFIQGASPILFSVTQVVMIPTLLRDVWLLLWIRSLLKQFDAGTMMMKDYYVQLKVVTLTDVGVTIALAMAMLLSWRGQPVLAFYLDQLVAACLALYLLYNGVKMAVRCFRALIDLPLPEEDQLKILKALTCEMDHFDGVGNVSTRQSGGVRFIEMELKFTTGRTVGEILSLRQRIKTTLDAHFPMLTFRLVPLPVDEKTVTPQGGACPQSNLPPCHRASVVR